MQAIKLKLYIHGRSPRNKRAIVNMQWTCEKRLNGNCELVVVDLKKNPEVLEKRDILVTPALVKEAPLPVRCVISDFSDPERILQGLGLYPWQQDQEDEAQSPSA